MVSSSLRLSLATLSSPKCATAYLSILIVIACISSGQTNARLTSIITRSHHKHHDTITKPTAVNTTDLFYVLSMSYQPEFCYTHRNDRPVYEGCRSPLDFWKGSLTLHGLWPQYGHGGWPSSCSSGNDNGFESGVVENIGLDRFEKYWPNVRVSPSTTSVEQYDTTFWRHEWDKHGTCSGLTQETYFRQALDNFLPTPPVLGEHYGKDDLSKKALVEAYGGPGRVVTVCSKGGYLTEVRACFRKDPANGEPMGRMACPDSVLEEDNCGESIAVSGFPSFLDTTAAIEPIMIE